MRQRLATGALLTLLVAPVLATVGIGTQYTNLVGTVLVWVFCGLMAPEVVAEVRRHRSTLPARVVLVGAVACLVGWTLADRPWITESRFWLHVGIVALVPAFAAWLQWRRRTGLRLLVLAKAAVTLVAVVLVTATLLQDPEPGSLPIYRNVRHLNYDVALLLVVLAHLVHVVRTRWATAGLMALIGALGWFSVWSGGRAQLVALAVIGVVLALTGGVHWRQPRFWLVPGGLVAGAAAVVLSGGSTLLTQQVERTVTDDPGRLTSGRIQLWDRTLAHLDSPAAVLFGRGPDAFDRLRLGPPSVLGADQRIVQAHNAVVQWLMEVGVVGTLLMLAVCGWLLVRAFRTAADLACAPERRLAAAMLIGLFAYAQFDGLLYHVVPFTIAAMLAAMTLFPLEGRTADRPPVGTAEDGQTRSSRALATSSAMASTSSSSESNRSIPRSRATNSTVTATS